MKYFPQLLMILGIISFSDVMWASAAPEKRTTQTKIKFYQENAQTIGEAFSKKSNKLLYREYHLIEGAQHQVFYINSQNKLWAQKTLTYEDNLLSPTVKQHNVINGKKLSVTHQNQQLQIVFGSKEKSVTPKHQHPLVIDAGFDHFIRAHWKLFAEGKAKNFDFVFSKGLRIISMQAKPISCKAKNDQRDSHRCFSLSPNNWALRLISNPISLEYNHHQQLMYYSGRSNISNDQDRTPHVSIHYTHTSSEEENTASLPKNKTPSIHPSVLTIPSHPSHPKRHHNQTLHPSALY